MKKLFTITCSLFALAAIAALDVIEILPGETTKATASGQVLAVRVLSNTAAGTATVRGVTPVVATALTAVVTETTNYTYKVVATNYVAGSLSTVTNTWAFDPYPYGHDNWISFTTNSVVAYSTNWTESVTSSLLATNAITSQITCSGGFGENAPIGKFVLAGEVLSFEGTADGKVLILLER